METVKLFVAGTPWYVYLIIVYLVFIGIKSVKGGSVHIKKLIILPIIFLYMSIETLFQHNSINVEQIAIWGLSLLVGAYLLGWLPYHKIGVKIAPEQHTIYVPGSFFTLFLIIITFAIKYSCAALIAAQYDFSRLEWNSLLFISGLFTGAFIGRFVYAAYHLYIKQNIH